MWSCVEGLCVSVGKFLLLPWSGVKGGGVRVLKRVFTIDLFSFAPCTQLQWWNPTIILESITNRRFPPPRPPLRHLRLDILNISQRSGTACPSEQPELHHTE